MLFSLTQTIPFPMPVIRIATGSLPGGVSNSVCTATKILQNIRPVYFRQISRFSNEIFIQWKIYVFMYITLYHVRPAWGPSFTLSQDTFLDPSAVNTWFFSPVKPICQENQWQSWINNQFNHTPFINCVLMRESSQTWWPQPFEVRSIVPVFRPKIIIARGPANLCSM